MEARSDFGAQGGTFHSKYSSACRTLENMLVLSQGPAVRRPGTKYIATVKTGSPVLLSFDYATDDTYIIEAGNLYMRFYRNGGQILDGSDPYEIVTPFAEANLFDIQIAQYDNVMYLVDGTNPPQRLTRSGHTSWTIEDAPIETGPFQAENETATTITPTGYSLAADATAETFTITGSGDLSTIFTDDKEFVVGGSTANDGTWTVSSTNAADPFIITVTEDITDGTNDGTILVQGGAVTLTASTGIFQSGHAGNGSYWEISQKRGTSTLKETLNSDTSSSSTASFTSGYSFTTSGTWKATVTLERSTDNGTTWDSALSPLNSINFDNPSEFEDDTVIHRVTMSDYVSGSCKFTHTISDLWNHGIVKVTGYTSGTVVTGVIVSNAIPRPQIVYDPVYKKYTLFGGEYRIEKGRIKRANYLASTDPTTRWREPYWSDYRGWPKTVEIHHQRLIFGGSDTFTQTIWFGKAEPDDYENFTEGTLDISSFTLALEGQNPITWLLGEDYLFIGTSGSCGRYGTAGESHTPTSPNYREQTRNGAKNIQATIAGNSILYIERGSRKIRELGFSLQNDKYVSTDLTQLSEDITSGGVIDAAFQARPEPILWCVLDSDIATLTYQREQNVVAWSLQITDGDFESVATIPSDDEDEIWVIVNRTNGRFIEQFQPRDWGSDDDDAWFCDAGIAYSGTATASFTGATHLANVSAVVYADGIIQPNVTVTSSGAFTLGTAASNVIVGHSFTSKLETMPIVVDPQDRAYNKKITALNLDFYKTGTCSFGNGPDSELTKINFFSAAVTTATQDLYTSTRSFKHVSFMYGPTKKQTIYLETDEPAPMMIRQIIPEFRITP
jgi:hypothetical protein